jgi:hypothetical protein
MSLPLHTAGPDFPEVGDGTCCAGAALYGPDRCTCWVAEYDLEQAEVDQEAVQALAAGVAPNTRDRMCPDCAYRPGSPEKSGDGTCVGDAGTLEGLAMRGERFWCHQGVRKPVAWRHPSGLEIPGHDGGYEPPIIAGVPYRADGSPAELCAGWDARRRALAVAKERSA